MAGRVGVEMRSVRGPLQFCLGDTGAWARLAGTEMERRDGFGNSFGDQQIWQDMAMCEGRVGGASRFGTVHRGRGGRSSKTGSEKRAW